MKLKTNEVKAFFKIADNVPTNNILPILSYVLLDDGCMVKSNLKTFISHKISVSQNERMLLEEKVMNAFMRECKSDEVEVKKDGNSVWLIEGKRKMKFQSADVNDFPKFPQRDKGDEFTFNEDALKAIGKAAKNVGSVGSNEVLDFVHLANDYIIGTDRAKFYCKKIDGIPNLVLDTETANTIAQFSSVIYYTSGKYNFFEAGNTLYGFIQAEAKTPNLTPFIPTKQPKSFIEIDVAEFTGFCDTVTSASPSKVLDCKMKGNKLSFVDADYDIDYDIELDSNGDYEPDVTFLPRVFGGYFKSIGFDTVKIAKAEVNNAALSVWSDDDPLFSGLIIGTKAQQK